MSETTDLHLPETMHIAPELPADKPEAEPAFRNPRDEVMARIARKYEEEVLGAELATAADMAAEAASHETPVPEADGAMPMHRDAAPASAPAPEPVASPPLHEITVQGQVFHVTGDQLQHLARVGVLANLALSQPPQQHTPQAMPHAPQHYAPAAGGSPLTDEQAGAILQRISYGSPEEGVSALRELASTMAGRADPAAIAEAATAQVLQRVQLQNDLQTIAQEYSEVFNNRQASMLAALNLAEIRQRDAAMGNMRPPLEQYREACGMVRQGLGSFAAGQQQQSVQAAPQSDRLERKRSVPRPVMAVSRSSGFGQEAPRPPSGSEIVASMRRARGQ